MARTPKDEIKRRLDLVEQTIQDRGWSGRIVRQLADTIGVDPRTIYRYRQEVLDDIAQGYRGIDRELAKGEFLLRLRDNMIAAKGDGRWGPVAAMLNMEGRVLGVFVEDAEQAAPAASLDDVVERLKELPQPIRERLAEVLIGAADG